MALITEMEYKNNQRPQIHREVKAKYSVFEIDGLPVLQIDNYKYNDNECEYGVKQTIQFNANGIKQLAEIIRELEQKIG